MRSAGSSCERIVRASSPSEHDRASRADLGRVGCERSALCGCQEIGSRSHVEDLDRNPGRAALAGLGCMGWSPPTA